MMPFLGSKRNFQTMRVYRYERGYKRVATAKGLVIASGLSFGLAQLLLGQTAPKGPASPQGANTKEHYHVLTSKDGLDCEARVGEMGSEYGIARGELVLKTSGEITSFKCQDKQGGFSNIELRSNKFTDGKIQTKNFGIIIMSTTGALSATYMMTDSQITKIKTFLRSLPKSPAGSQYASSIDKSFSEAVQAGDLAHIKTLLKAKPALVFSKDLFGNTPLHEATKYDQESVVELLLANHANVNAKNDNGETALHWAASNGRKGIAEVLIANKADVNAMDLALSTPLKEAALAGQTEMQELLRQHGGHE